MTVDPGRIDAMADEGWDAAVGALLDAAADEPTDAAEPPEAEDLNEIIGWWVGRMLRPENGLRDRMAWFWHGLLTTSADKVSETSLVRDQLIGLRTNALGDYRTLLHQFVTGGALLEYLDASYSMASNPNENLARELMELFTLGRGNYTEDDVRAAARALAGWVVEDGDVEWRRENAFVAPLLFRGIQDEWDMATVVDHLCDQPETAIHVSSRLWRHLVGGGLDSDEAVELGWWWQERDLSIIDLVERILGEKAMAEQRLNRARTGAEWYVAFRSVTDGADAAAGVGDETDDGETVAERNAAAIWELETLGQAPYYPPNVGGWPDGVRWLSAGSLLPRISLINTVDTEALFGGRSGTTDDILDRCGLHEVSEQTLAVLDQIRSSEDLPGESAHLVKWRLALSSPEFNLS